MSHRIAIIALKTSLNFRRETLEGVKGKDLDPELVSELEAGIVSLESSIKFLEEQEAL